MLPRSETLVGRGAVVVAAFVLVGCSPGPIDWREPTPLPWHLASAADLEFDAQQNLVGRPAPAIATPVFAGQCAGSTRLARDSSGLWYAVWWGARRDSTADIRASRSADGVVWTPAIVVDSLDAGASGCRRPPPSITADGANVFVVYAMTAKEGPGIFASHSMDRGTMFHSPVTVVYGERIGQAAVAARGDIVAVAYEDPNSATRRIALALSRTMGHLFQSRASVSPSAGGARDPRVILGDGRIAVTWHQQEAAWGTAADAPATRVVRIGALR